MDRFELVEKLVKSTGVSYEDAKTALEASGWDLLDAAVWLEKNGKVEGKASHFSTNPEQQEEQRKQQEEERRKEERARDTVRNSSSFQSSGRGVLHTILRKAKEIIMDNELIVCKRSGEVFLEIPIWLFIILLVVSFWTVIIAMGVLFFIGFRYRLGGPDLGSERVNNILNRAENAAGDFIDRVKNQNSSPKYKAYDATRSGTQTGDDVYDYTETSHREE